MSNVGLGLLCLAVMVAALAGAMADRRPWLWYAGAAFIALGAALVSFGVIAV